MRKGLFGLAAAVSLAGCAVMEDVGAERRSVVLVAPESFRALGEPWEITDVGGWSISRAKGCILPGETVEVEVLQKASLWAGVPRAGVLIDQMGNEEDENPLGSIMVFAGAAQARVTGSGTPGDPYIVRWENLDRWRAFVEDWERYPTDRREISRSRQIFMEFEADAARLKGISTVQALEALFSERPDIQEGYYLWLDDLEGGPYTGCA